MKTEKKRQLCTQDQKQEWWQIYRQNASEEQIPKEMIIFFTLYLSPFIKIISKWIAGLNIKPETVTLLEENIRENLCDLELDKDFLDITAKKEP